MKAELGVKTAKAFVKAMENTNDMALIYFEADGLRTKLMDNNGYRLLDLKIPSEAMLSYEFNETNAVEFGVVVSHIKDMTKGMTVKDKHTLSLEYDLEDPTWLSLTSCGVNRKLRLLKSSMMKRHKTPTLSPQWSAKIPYKSVKAFLTSIGKTEVFNMNLSESELSLVAETDEGTMQIDLSDIDLHFEKEVLEESILLGTENFSLAICTTDSKSVLYLRGGDSNTPLELEWKIEGLLLKTWVATRTRK